MIDNEEVKIGFEKIPLEKGERKQVLKEGVMPDGTRIQLEDWSGYVLHKYADTIAAYPKSKANLIREGIKQGENFRVSFRFNNQEQAENVFERLIAGTADLIDYDWYIESPRLAICL